ncbi:hypothetical protein D3C73_709680 [compost metagenome]
MEIPFSLAMSIDNWSLIEPPGCNTAAIPASEAISTQSGKGKKASDAIAQPLRSKPKEIAFSIACFNASTREVWPTPEANKVPFLANTIVFDLVCFTILFAK